MYQFFVEPEQIDVAGKSVIIRGADVNHIKNVLRMRPGEEVATAGNTVAGSWRWRKTVFVWNYVLSRKMVWSFPQRSTCSRGCPRRIKWNSLFKKQWNWELFR